jgi:hypothetical protein
MKSGDYQFERLDSEHGRVLETIYPETVDIPKLAAVIADYYGLWDESTPTAALGNIGRLRHMSPDARDVSQALFSRFVKRENYVGAAWYTEGNAYARELWTRILANVPGSQRMIFDRREDALAYLEARLAARADAEHALEA